MSGAFRLRSNGRVDHARPLRFSFDGRELTGLTGDTLASALLANGTHFVGRSFKYHRPRGILAAGAEEPNALVTVSRDAARSTPNLRATQVELYDGLRAESQNRTPSLRFDVGAASGLLAPVLPAGFYYKTFMWPRGAWKRVYEPAIRAMAGLGHAPRAPDPDRYAQRFAHCDVLVVGAGPAGLAAARAAAGAGARVILCDEQAEFGGSLLATEETARLEGSSAADWLALSLATLRANERVTLLPRTTAFGCFPHNLIGLAERVTDHLASPDPALPRERLWQVRAKQVVLGAGAIERPLVFANNDRPGIMLAGAALTYLRRYAVRLGTRAVVATADDAGYDAALALSRSGLSIAAIVDQRTEPRGELPEAARAAGLSVRTGGIVVGSRGRLRVSAALLASGTPQPESVACDLLLMCGGFTPSVHLFSQARGQLRFDEAAGAFLPEQADGLHCAGAARGLRGLAEAAEDGEAAGAAAARAAGFATRERSRPAEPATGPGLAKASASGRAFVDFQNDVTAKDIVLAAREGFRSIEHVKRYTTAGMATDQGKISSINVMGLVAAALDRPVPLVGHTTFRMPYTPVTFGAFAGPARGELFEPVRTTPIHGWAEAHGALFEDVGNWKRARAFPRSGEDSRAAIARECRAVRDSVGIFDASTLGKVEVVGPDAAEFLNRMYVNSWTKLGVGRCRYGVMLREDGFVLDDGVVGRLAPDRFHVTTTTGGAARVLGAMEDYLQTEWPDLDVWLTSVTEQWAVIAVQGPQARDVVAPLIEGADVGPAAMPHMSVRDVRICGIPGRLFRVSFTGELGFELNIPADQGLPVWEAVMAAGEAFDITPYGTDAMHVLRAEKGYIVVGQETDGTATPDDVGLGWAIGKAKPDFVGKRSLARPEMMRSDRKQLVGLLPEDPANVPEEGAQIVTDPKQRVPMTMLGHVTSAYFSAELGRSIALAMIAGGRARIGERLYLPMPGRDIAVTVTAPVLYDPEGARLNG